MKPVPQCGSVRKLTDQRYLNLFNVEVQRGENVRPWTFASRDPQPCLGKHRAAAVVIVAVVPANEVPAAEDAGPGGEPRLLIIREFRPALGGYELSLPAGLIDAGEDSATAAARELWEETGLRLTRVAQISPPVASSAGLTDETVVFVYGEAAGTLSADYLEAHEDIDARLVTLAELRTLIASETADVLSGRLYAVAMGFFTAGRIALPPAISPPAEDGKLTTLFRPVGPAELELIRAAGFRAFPPRLPGQPIFYPVLNEGYATEIARDWNAKESGAGYVTRFQVPSAFLTKYERQVVGNRTHAEIWVPADELPELNRQLVGLIEVVAEFQVPAIPHE